MITFIFSVGEQSRHIDIPHRITTLANLKGDIDAVTASLPCPNHKFNSSATILLRGFYYCYKWEVLDSCCSEFKQAIESAVQSACNAPETYPGS